MLVPVLTLNGVPIMRVHVDCWCGDSTAWCEHAQACALCGETPIATCDTCHRVVCRDCGFGNYEACADWCTECAAA